MAGRRVVSQRTAWASRAALAGALAATAAAACAADDAGWRPLVPHVDAPPASVQVPAGARLPLDAAFVDSTGRAAPLGDWLGGRPALVVPGYYTCPQLCGLLLQGVLEGLHADGLDGGDAPARVVSVSVDPADTPLTAARRLAVSRSYAAFLAGQEGNGGGDGDAPRDGGDRGGPASPAARGPSPDLVFLTGSPVAIRALTSRLGWRYQPQPPAPGDPSAARFAHPAAVFVVDGAGRLRSVLGGLRFPPGQLRAALHAADGPPTPDAATPAPLTVSGAIALLCAHFDPRAGRHSEAVMQAARAVSMAVLAGLAALAWRASRRRGPGRTAAKEDRP